MYNDKFDVIFRTPMRSIQHVAQYPLRRKSWGDSICAVERYPLCAIQALSSGVEKEEKKRYSSWASYIFLVS